MNCPQVPVSIGELIDKITILQIKSKYSDNDYITKELEYLTRIAKEMDILNNSYTNQLKEINQILWNIEDEIRILEKENKFDDRFIHLARQVYINNDKRAEIKKQINELTNSEFREIKLY